MNNPLKFIGRLWLKAMKTKEDKHREFIQKQFDEGRILLVEGVKYE